MVGQEESAKRREGNHDGDARDGKRGYVACTRERPRPDEGGWRWAKEDAGPAATGGVEEGGMVVSC